MALCSLSTGRIFTPFSRAFAMTISPAITRVSLFASAISIPFSIALRVGFNPTLPETATNIISFSSFFEQISSSPFTKYLHPLIFPSLTSYLSEETYLGRNFLACSSNKSVFKPPARAVISNLSCKYSRTSSACLPIEPVEPIILILRLGICRLFLIFELHIIKVSVVSFFYSDKLFVRSFLHKLTFVDNNNSVRIFNR